MKFYMKDNYIRNTVYSLGLCVTAVNLDLNNPEYTERNINGCLVNQWFMELKVYRAGFIHNRKTFIFVC